jgi:flagellar motor component MotA
LITILVGVKISKNFVYIYRQNLPCHPIKNALEKNLQKKMLNMFAIQKRVIGSKKGENVTMNESKHEFSKKKKSRPQNLQSQQKKKNISLN